MSDKVRIGIIREGKVPPDMRVPLTPQQCVKVQDLYPEVEIQVQTSPIRAFKDEEYTALGIKVVEDLSDCDIILGVKEVNIEDLIPGKKFMFFSHTIKKQPYNRKLLQAIIEKKIQLIDYEVLKDKHGKRVIGFGRYAGIVGCYNGFRTFGLKHGLYELKPANMCADRKEMEAELHKVILPKHTRILLTGFGRVGHGAVEIIDQLPIKEVSPEEYLKGEFDEPVYTHLEVEDYFERKNGGEFDKSEFYSSPDLYRSSFAKYINKTDLYVPCHYWNNKADFILKQSDLQRADNRITVVADISCDIDGPIACTVRPSKISDPIYGYDPATGQESDFMKDGVVAVMAVDNLPCELPKDASADFGNELIKEVFPALLRMDVHGMIDKGSETTLEGKLNEPFLYLQDYLDGKE
ncbi:MAG: alanine dehydrogenase [Bacteroidetes bacterium]|nr:MAG: alanine dehydrogenase [Bacteroidota bacterium]TNE96057.1 MAG: alanine dehydrogenase [Bacteroidota bacterium]